MNSIRVALHESRLKIILIYLILALQFSRWTGLKLGGQNQVSEGVKFDHWKNNNFLSSF